MRVMKDIKEFYTENSNEMFVVTEDEDMTVVHALMIGPEKTPYQNGFFYFVLRFGFISELAFNDITFAQIWGRLSDQTSDR